MASWVGLPPRLCELLVRRGFRADPEVRRFLRPSFADLHDPKQLDGVPVAVERIIRAIDREEPILVHGDYDVDGMTGASLLTLAIRDLGGRAEPFVPHRGRDGYDLGPAGVAAAREARAGLIVTADCGITAVEAVRDAARVGMDVIVTDHHRPGPELPPALAVVNPNLEGSTYPFRGLAGVGVAFKLVQELFVKKHVREGQLNQYLDLVALGTIADQATLEGENRALSRFGLNVLNRTRRPGLQALCRAANVGRWSEVSAGDVGFRIAPRLNSAGRMAEASDGLRLLLTEDFSEAETLAERVESLNTQRRDTDRAVLDDARAQIAEDPRLADAAAITLWADGWHPGVLGIVASRLTEEFHRPVVLIGIDGSRGKGSARSVPGFHLYNALATCRDLFERFGGHAAAAGFEISIDRLDALRERLDAATAEVRGRDIAVPPRGVHAELPISEVTEALSRGLRYLSPFGSGNPMPKFVAEGVRLRDVEPVGDGTHARCVLEDGTAEVEAIGFGLADRAAEFAGQRTEVLYELHVEAGHRGLRTQAHLKAIGRPAGL